KDNKVIYILIIILAGLIAWAWVHGNRLPAEETEYVGVESPATTISVAEPSETDVESDTELKGDPVKDAADKTGENLDLRAEKFKLEEKNQELEKKLSEKEKEFAEKMATLEEKFQKLEKASGVSKEEPRSSQAMTVPSAQQAALAQFESFRKGKNYETKA